ncbi:hypothetical protein D3C71_1046850 [compost metagenome]
MRKGALGGVDRQMGEVWAAKPLQLRIEIGEVTALQERVIAETDARGNVLRHERDLLCLGEEVVRHAVQHHSPDRLYRQDLFRDDLGRV